MSTTTTTTTTTAQPIRPQYELCALLRRPQDQSKVPIYSVEFFPADSGTIFACSGGRRVTIFEIVSDASQETEDDVQALRGFFDEDEEEDFYCSCWTVSSEADGQKPLLCVGGEAGIVKILDVDTCALWSYLSGHGGPIYDVTVHPKDSDLIISCGKDESVRLWSISARRCLVVFAGEQSHRDSVLSIDVHSSGNWLASSGMDNTVKIWELDSEAVTQAIIKGRASDENSHGDHQSGQKQSNGKRFKAPFVQFPAFTTRRIHTDYVDCVKWIGDLVMTKSIESKCCLWKPDTRRRANSVALLRVYPYADGTLWFVRFGVNHDFSVMAVAGDDGKIYLYDIDAGGPPYQILPHANMEALVRSVRFSQNEQYLVGCGDDGIIRCFRRKC